MNRCEWISWGYSDDHGDHIVDRKKGIFDDLFVNGIGHLGLTPIRWDMGPLFGYEH